tara:strand:- start:1342 stop:1578 length:237 start_codon:yes stop_codon:yes gene_type:complete
MVNRVTFTLDNEAHRFLESSVGRNKSAFINDLLHKESKRQLREAIIRANKEEAADQEYQNELALWDATLSDGLPPVEE